VPSLTEERRKQLVKKVRGMGEEAKTAIRQIRRDANEEIKRLEKDGEVSEDDARRGLDEVQKRTDRHTAKIDELNKNKEQELMEI
jgi:ribosome recycling factor